MALKVDLLTPEGKILLALERAGGRAKTARLLEETGLPKPTFYNKLKLLIALGLVHKIDDTVILTPQGEAKLAYLLNEIAGR